MKKIPSTTFIGDCNARETLEIDQLRGQPWRNLYANV